MNIVYKNYIKSVCLPALGNGVNRIPIDLSISTIRSYFNDEIYRAGRYNINISLCLNHYPSMEDGYDLLKRIYLYIAQHASSSEEIDEYFK